MSIILERHSWFFISILSTSISSYLVWNGFYFATVITEPLCPQLEIYSYKRSLLQCYIRSSFFTWQNWKTSESTTHEPSTSKLTTHQTMTSKSLSRMGSRLFRRVSSKQKNHFFHASISNSKTHKWLEYWAFYTPSLLPLTSILPSQHGMSGETCL